MTNEPNLIARLLGRKGTDTPATEIQRALDQLNMRAKAINQRLVAIQKGSAINGGPGPERKRVLEIGSPDEIVAMDQEVQKLLAERDQQIPAQIEALSKRLEHAEVEEARERLPERLKSVPDLLARHQKAAEALRFERESLDAAVSDVIEARRLAGDDSAALDERSIAQIADLRGLKESEDPSRFNLNRARLFQSLGGTLPEKAAPDYVRTRKEVERESEEFYKESGDGQTTRRQTGYLEKGGALRDRS